MLLATPRDDGAGRRATRAPPHRQHVNADLIGQAKGVLMERHKITADRAFRLLARASQNINRRLADIAFSVTSSGQEPDDAAGTQ